MNAILLASAFFFTMPDSTSPAFYPFPPPIFHHPPKVLLNTRAFDLELFIKIPRDSIKTISLFYQTDEMPRMEEVPFEINSPRIKYHYDPKERPAEKITYYFIVSVTGGPLYATPVDSSGILRPITKYLLDPEYYFKRRATIR